MVRVEVALRIGSDISLGDLVYITLAGQGMLILNSYKVSTDLLERRAAIYSDRPRLIGK